MGADTSSVQRIVCRDLVLPYIGDAHELAPLWVVFDMDPMLHVGGLANAHNLFCLTARRPLLRETGGGLVGVHVSSARWRRTASKGSRRYILVDGQGRGATTRVPWNITRGGVGGRRSSVVTELMMVVAAGGQVPVLRPRPRGLLAHDEEEAAAELG